MSRAMKDSGIPWIGEIPKDWELCRFKNFVRLQTTPSVSNKKIGLENIESETGKYIETESKFEGDGVQFYQGDIVYGKLRPYLRKVWLATFDGNAVGDFFVFKARTGSDSNYVKWLLLSDGYTEAVNSSVYGAKMPRVSSDFILTLPYFLPPLPEQQRIAEFLNMKCGEIDEAIALQEEFIEELKAYKQSVITEAVTRGLNPNVKYKDSGIDWIGMIPERWHLSFLKNYYCFEKGKNASLYTKEYIGAKTGCYPVYSGQTGNNGIMGFIDSYDYDIDECVFTTTVGAKVMTPKILRGKFSLSQNCLIMKRKSSNVSNRFVYYWLHPLFNYCKSLIPTYMQPSLRIEDLQTYCMLFPPIDEQQQIADYLDSKCTEIDSIITIKQRKIEELKDYKKSIIYEYVTGKKEVLK